MNYFEEIENHASVSISGFHHDEMEDNFILVKRQLQGFLYGLICSSKINASFFEGLESWLYSHQKIEHTSLKKFIDETTYDLIKNPEKVSLEWIKQELSVFYKELQDELGSYKTVEECYGICRSLVQDSKLDRKKLASLEIWIDQSDFEDKFIDALKKLLHHHSNYHKTDEFFADLKELIHCLESQEMMIQIHDDSNISIELKNNSFFFLGEDLCYSRGDFEDYIRGQGGFFHEQVSRETNYIIVCENKPKQWKEILKQAQKDRKFDLQSSELWIVSSAVFLSIANESLSNQKIEKKREKDVEKIINRNVVNEFVKSYIKPSKAGEFSSILSASEDNHELSLDVRSEYSVEEEAHNFVINNYINRLTKASRVSSFLNCNPGARRNRFDFSQLDFVEPGFSQKIIDSLHEKASFQVKIDLRVGSCSVKKVHKKMLIEYPHLDTLESLHDLENALTIESDRLDRKLQHFYKDNLQLRKERGYDVLMLGYPILHIPERNKGSLLAPLFFWPFSMRNIKPKIWEFSLDVGSGRSIEQNTPLYDEFSQRGIHLDEISESFFDHKLLSASDLKKHIEHIAKHIPGLKISHPFQIQAFPHSDILRKRKSPSFLPMAMLGTFSHQKESIIKDLESIREHGIHKFSSLDFLKVESLSKRSSDKFNYLPVNPFFKADFSQKKTTSMVLHHDSNTIIYGPPGTGKSQVISEILCQAILKNKTVLVCCDKATALHVLMKRLASLGLSESCAMILDSKKDRLSLYKYIRDYREHLDSVGPAVVCKLEKIKLDQQRVLKNKNDLLKLDSEIYGNHLNSFFKLLSRYWELEKNVPKTLKIYPSFLDEKKNDIEDIIKPLKELHYYFKLLEVRQSSVLKFVRLNIYNNKFVTNLYDHYIILKKYVDQTALYEKRKYLPKASPEHEKNINRIMKNALQWTSHEKKILISILDKSLDVRKIECINLEKISNLEISDQIAKCNYAVKGVSNKKELKNQIKSVISAHKLLGSNLWVLIFPFYFLNYFKVRKLSKNIGCENFNLSTLSSLKLDLEEIRRCYEINDEIDQLTVTDLKILVDKKNSLQRIKKDLNLDSLSQLNEIINDDWGRFLAENLDHDHELKAALDYYEAKEFVNAELKYLYEAPDLAPHFKEKIKNLNHQEEVQTLIPSLALLLGEYNDFLQLWPRVLLLMNHCRKYELSGKIASFFAGLNLDYSLVEWSSWLEWSWLKIKIESQVPLMDGNHSSYGITEIIKNLLDQENTLSDGLLKYSIYERHQKLKDDLSKYSNVSIRSKFALRGKTSRTLRESFEMDGGLLKKVKPIWLTTPDTACSIFPLEENLFDLVIFDEASQCKVEDILPVMVRGTNLVISGDEHQMPPTSFFSKTIDVDDFNTLEENCYSEEELEQLEFDQQAVEGRDLLSLAKKRDFSTSMLQMHYRSQSEDLIRFSSHLFYQNRLKVIPHSTLDESGAAIEFHQISGVLENRTNRQEAEAIVELLCQLSTTPNARTHSIGIVSFNSDQRYLIWDVIEDQRLKDRGFSEFLNHHMFYEIDGEDHSLFVKNLEEVQGDERDIIIISTTFAPNPKGAFYRRFGPLCQKNGEKRLNVLVTRAKKKIHVMTSIPAVEYEQNLDLVFHQSRQRGIFYAYLRYSKAVSEGRRRDVDGVIDWIDGRVSDHGTYTDLHQEVQTTQNEIVIQKIVDKLEQSHDLKCQSHYSIGSLSYGILVSSENGPVQILIDIGSSYDDDLQKLEESLDRVRLAVSRGFKYFYVDLIDWWRNQCLVVEDILCLLQNED